MSDVPTDKALRALEADALLKNPLFNHAFNALEGAIVDDIKNADVMDDNYATKMMLALQNLKAVRDCLEGYITDAEYEAKPSEAF